MILRRIYIKNFMSHIETEIDCTKFNSCLILGRNKNNYRKSNGVGKSTIFIAINYVLFGEVPAKKVDQIVKDNEDNCVVEIDFELNNVIYRATRKRFVKSNKSEFKLKIWSGEEWVKSDYRTSSATEKAFQELLKINNDTFKNAVLFEQSSFSAIAEGTDTDRRKILKNPLNLSVYSIYEKNAKLKLNKLEQEFNTNKTLISQLGDPIVDILSLNDTLSQLKNNITILNDKKNNISDELSRLRQQKTDIEKLLSIDIVEVNKQLSDNDSKIKDITSKLYILQSQIDKYKKEIDNKAKDLKLYNVDIINKENKLKVLKEISIRDDEVILNEIKALEEKEVKGIKYLAGLELNYKKFNKPLPTGSQCSECFSELTDEYRNKISQENSLKLKEINVNISDTKLKLSKLVSSKKLLNSELNNNKSHILEINNLNNDIVNIKNNIGNIDNNINKTRELYDNLINSGKGYEESIKIIEESNKELKNIKERYKGIDANILALKLAIRDKEREENEIIQGMASNATLIGINEEKKNSREKDRDKLVELVGRYDELERDVRILGRVVKAFSPSGIPTLIIHTILDDLQTEANIILQDLRPEISLRFVVEKEDKDVMDIIYTVEGRERPYTLLSGGQKVYVSFALKKGLSEVIQKLLGIDIKFLLLDEVDQALDLDGQDAFVEIIKRYENKVKIFVITHNDRLKDKFENIVMVEGDDKGSVGRLA